ncbi:MAG TPA: DegQ family serine endoprotease [Aestuariivirga sp.]|jgi:Do/DeqQ family serine protease|nr:DegQ family serine endoprotease [Hyphomicrobiales bacterium]HQY72079.1 DegQ family serine endoprotease [Aestuariivirga sp.]HRA92746.1 DegQ family serine endoprotease [Aestuariivirga sp.]
MRLFVTLAFACLTLSGLPALAETAVPQNLGQMQLSFAPVVKTTAPAVVNVYSKTLAAQDSAQGLFNDPFFRQFFGERGNFGRPRKQVENSLGSGVIVDARGLIVTNNHVIRGGTDIRVVLADKREFEAKLLLADERSDLAILKIEVGDEELAALPFGDSDNLEVGDLVLAIGNPFGVGQTVTSGIVSALARTQVGISDYQFFIQTDAAINPGNSGGALVNMAGELVGINTAIFSRSGGSIGIGFSIPSNMVRTVVQSAESGTKILRPWSGANLQDVTADIAESLGFARPEGALVASLHPDSPLLAAGLKQGDVILALDGHPIENAKEFNYRVATSQIGQASIIEYQRGGKAREASIKLVAAPETTDRAETLMEGKNPLQGMVVANLSPAVAEELGVPSSLSGVIALDIKGGVAKRFFRKGDILLEVNGVSIASVEDLEKAVSVDESYWEIQINRGGRKLQMTLR